MAAAYVINLQPNETWHWGTVNAQPSRVAGEGTLVTVTATPNSGYRIKTFTSSDVTLSGSGNTRTFTMPSKMVTIVVEFELTPTLVWSSSRYLSFVQKDSSVEVTLHGSATSNVGWPVTYYLYKGSTGVGYLSNGKCTASLSSSELGTRITYKVQARATGPSESLIVDGPSDSFTAVTHTLGWTNAGLSASSTGKVTTLTMSGYATDSWGKSVTYYLYKENALVATFNANKATITLAVSELGVSKQYKVIAAAGGLTAEGKAIAYTTPLPTVSWDSGVTMYGSEVENNQARVGVTGGAHINSGYTGNVYYRVYIDNVQKNGNTDTSREWTLAPDILGVEHVYKIDAFSVIEGITCVSPAFEMALTIVEKSRVVGFYDGTEWKQAVMHYYDGSDWVEVEPYYYDGTDWILCSMI